MGNTPSTSNSPPPNNASSSTCPVDPAARAAWLEEGKSASHPQPPTSQPSPSSETSSPPPQPKIVKTRPLASDRVISSIPRTATSPSTTTPTPTSTPSSPPSPDTSNWIYPSEKMFFEAMKRKNHTPNASDMATVVPIHNAVNERAWAEIKTWERRFAPEQNASCDGPRLRSFSGDSKRWSPRARWNGLWGYERPFDRHDWVVERCEGPVVEYVIDFYRGRGGGLSFYLDVRPKLNSWEGWRMRALRSWGFKGS